MNKYTSDFNKFAEKELDNRISPYNLNENEMREIWQIVGDKNATLEKHEKNFNSILKEEYERLLSERGSHAELNLGRATPTNATLELVADNLVRANYFKEEKNINRECDQKIDAILENAREDGRGPGGHNNDMVHNNDRDNDYDR